MGLVAWDCTKIPTERCSTSLESSIIISLSFQPSHIKAACPGLYESKADEGLHPEEDWGLEFAFPALNLVSCRFCQAPPTNVPEPLRTLSMTSYPSLMSG